MEEGRAPPEGRDPARTGRSTTQNHGRSPRHRACARRAGFETNRASRSNDAVSAEQAANASLPRSLSSQISGRVGRVLKQDVGITFSWTMTRQYYCLLADSREPPASWSGIPESQFFRDRHAAFLIRRRASRGLALTMVYPVEAFGLGMIERYCHSDRPFSQSVSDFTIRPSYP